MAGKGKDVNGWLFGNIDTGRPYHADSLRQDHLAPAGRKAGIPNLGWHNFRHTLPGTVGQFRGCARGAAETHAAQFD